MHSSIFDLILVVIGALGLTLASYIFRCKHKKKPLVCPLKKSCDFVTTSKYSKFLGIPVETLGMTYYALVVLVHLIMFVFPGFITQNEIWLGLAASTGAFIFSLYLTSIQAFVLKQWCTWCLCSATLCLLIFITTYFSAPAGFF